MWILGFKVLHIVGFTAWFAGLFYLVRIFVYHTEAWSDEEPQKSILSERYHLMEVRVYNIICNPALVITWVGGLAMIYLYGWEWFTLNTWLHIKIILILGLSVYHLYCGRLLQKLNKGVTGFSSFQFRLFNEVPALFLIAIVIFAIFKNVANGIYAFLIIVVMAFLFFAFAKIYQKVRKN